MKVRLWFMTLAAAVSVSAEASIKVAFLELGYRKTDSLVASIANFTDSRLRFPKDHSFYPFFDLFSEPTEAFMPDTYNIVEKVKAHGTNVISRFLLGTCLSWQKKLWTCPLDRTVKIDGIEVYAVKIPNDHQKLPQVIQFLVDQIGISLFSVSAGSIPKEDVTSLEAMMKSRPDVMWSMATGNHGYAVTHEKPLTGKRVVDFSWPQYLMTEELPNVVWAGYQIFPSMNRGNWTENSQFMICSDCHDGSSFAAPQLAYILAMVHLRSIKKYGTHRRWSETVKSLMTQLPHEEISHWDFLNGKDLKRIVPTFNRDAALLQL